MKRTDCANYCVDVVSCYNGDCDDCQSFESIKEYFKLKKEAEDLGWPIEQLIAHYKKEDRMKKMSLRRKNGSSEL